MDLIVFNSTNGLIFRMPTTHVVKLFGVHVMNSIQYIVFRCIKPFVNTTAFYNDTSNRNYRQSFLVQAVGYFNGVLCKNKVQSIIDKTFCHREKR
jgi:hypothetical protein